MSNPIYLTMNFMGICTFLSDVTVGGSIVPKRVVLLNLTGNNTVGGFTRIPQHFAKVTVNGQTTDLNQFRGCTISIVQADGQPLPPNFVTDSTFAQNIPNLTNLVSPIETLGPPAQSVLTGNQPDLVAAYVDLNFGVLSGEQIQTAESASAQTTLTIPTSFFDFEVVFPLLLQIQPFAGPAEPMAIALPMGSTVTINNSAPDETLFNGQHFLLHYLVANELPLMPQLPQLPGPQVNAPLPGTLGCSNSSYP